MQPPFANLLTREVLLLAYYKRGSRGLLTHEFRLQSNQTPGFLLPVQLRRSDDPGSIPLFGGQEPPSSFLKYTSFLCIFEVTSTQAQTLLVAS